MSDDYTPVAETVNGFDVEMYVLTDFPAGTEEIIHHAVGGERCSASMVFILEVRCRKGEFVSINCRVRVRGR